MSLPATLARIAELQSVITPVPAAPATPAAAPGAFASALGQAMGPTATTALAGPAPGGGGVGARVVALAQAELGVTEQPPGSNDGPRIAEYRRSTPGGGIGPWCSYFTSWLAQQAGAPVGNAGQGFGAVADVWAWAQSAGRAIPAGSAPPQPGDLIIWNGRHMGVVEAVLPDGRIQTIEGNSSDMVARRTHGPDGDGATGYVRLG